METEAPNVAQNAAPSPATSTAATLPPLALVAPAASVARDLQIQVKIGSAIREHRLRDHRDLEIARAEKQEWVQRCTELLTNSFNHAAAADQFGNWVAPILPEYAEFGMFVELFNAEMKHRLAQLKAIGKSLRSMPDFLQLQKQKGTDMVTLTESPNGADQTTDNPAAAAPTIAQAMQAAQAAAALRTQANRAASGATNASSRASTGLLIVRTGDTAACESVRQFVEQLGLALHVSQRSTAQSSDHANPSDVSSDSAASSHPLLDELSAMQSSPASFALLFTDASNQPQQFGEGDALFDLGCCVGRLGSSRVIVLHRNGDPHVDRFGLTHIIFDPHEGWRLQLARQLKRSGVDVDLNKLI